MFWNDIAASVWIGGTGDGGLHERTPYWLNGVVPLSFLLENSKTILPSMSGLYKATHNAPLCQNNTDMRNSDIRDFPTTSAATCRQECVDDPACVAFVINACTATPHCWLKSSIGTIQSNVSCRCFGKVPPRPLKKVNMTEQVETYIQYILSHQNEKGWLGPDSGSMTDGGQFWGPSNVLQALYQYAEGRKSRGDSKSFDNATLAVRLHLLEQQRRMVTAKLTSWAAARWIDMALTAEWLLDHDDGLQGQNRSKILRLVSMLHEDGSDWDSWFETFTGGAGGHNVNNAQGLKSAAVWYRYNKSVAIAEKRSRERMYNLDRLYGLPTGMFNGDEILPTPPTRSPSRGIELCGVVEAMFSYGIMFSVHGDVSFADRVERIAYVKLFFFYFSLFLFIFLYFSLFFFIFFIFLFDVFKLNVLHFFIIFLFFTVGTTHCRRHGPVPRVVTCGHISISKRSMKLMQ